VARKPALAIDCDVSGHVPSSSLKSFWRAVRPLEELQKSGWEAELNCFAVGDDASSRTLVEDGDVVGETR